MSSCCGNPILGSRFNSEWGRLRCSMGNLPQRLAVYNDSSSACTTPFAPASNTLALIEYFPVSGFKLAKEVGKLTDDIGLVSIVSDSNQNINDILKGNKLILLDIDTRRILISGVIRSWQQFSPTDTDINFTSIRTEYNYEQIFIGEF